ncbi:MAG: hypothetical protein RBT81_10985 [Gammaproteobacteria bacterium]|nr:hypothetical protein [Gammaproteobacteria bacterium]
MHARLLFRSAFRRVAPFRFALALPGFLLLTACNSGSDSHPVMVQGAPAVGVLKDAPPEPRARVHAVTTAAGTGGSINPAATTVSEGETALLTVLAEPGWMIDSVSGCGGELIAGHRYRTASLSAPCTVTAVFVAQNHSVSTVVRSNRGGTTEGDGTFVHGTEVTVRALPESGFEFIAWTEGSTIVSTDAEFTFTLEANRSLSADFDLARNVTQVRMPPAGLVTLFEAHNAPPGVVFAVTGEAQASDGNEAIWRSEDGGGSWTRVADVQARFISIGVDDPELVIAGTDDGYLLSRDGGRQWSEEVLTLPGGQAVRLSAAGLASEAQGIYAASAAVTTAGLYRSLDGGASWVRVISAAQAGTLADAQIRHVEVSRADPLIVHAATGSGDNIWRSVDGGASFFSIRAGIADDRPQVFDAGVRSDPADAARILVENHVSLNGGADWTQIVLPPRTVELSNPDDPDVPFEVELGEETMSPGNTVWLDGALLRVSGNRLLVSRDAGLNWETLLDLVGATGDFDTTRLHLAADALYLQLTGGPNLIHRIDLGLLD